MTDSEISPRYNDQSMSFIDTDDWNASPWTPAGPDANDGLALDLYARLRQPHQNLCFSPWSISIALAMLHAGARGETREEIEVALHLAPAEQVQTPAVANKS